MLWVRATDSYLSGWGAAQGKKNVMVFECKTRAEADWIEAKLLARSEMKHVMLCANRPVARRGVMISYCTRETHANWYPPEVSE